MASISSPTTPNAPLPTMLRRAGVDPAHMASSHPLFNLRYTREFFDRLIAGLYRPYVSSNLSPKVTVTSYIMQDGFGDLARVGHVFDLLTKAFPSWTLSAAGIIERYEERKDRVARVIDGRFDFFPNDYLAVSDDTPLALCTPDIVVYASTYSGLTHSKAPSKELYFYEYGHGPYLSSTGVEIQHSGLLFSAPVTQGLHELKSAPLKSLLLSSCDSCEYKEHTDFMYGYFGNSYSFSTSFLLAICSLLKNSHKNIDLVTSNPTLEILDRFIDYFKKTGIGQIDFYRCNQENVFELSSSITCSDLPEPTGKTIRLIISPFLPFQDVQILMSQSHLVAGCVGDCSFSEAISYGKLPFYFIYSPKIKFFDAFIDLAQAFFKQLNLPYEKSDLVDYLKLIRLMKINLERELSTEEISRIKSAVMAFGFFANSPRTHQEFQQFRAYLMENYNANEAILDAVAHAAVHLEHPSLKMDEDRIFQDYSTGRISAEESLFQIEHMLKEHVNPVSSPIFYSMKQEDLETLDLAEWSKNLDLQVPHLSY